MQVRNHTSLAGVAAASRKLSAKRSSVYDSPMMTRWLCCAFLALTMELHSNSVSADEPTPEEQSAGRQEEAALNEDPEAQRRARIQDEPELVDKWPSFEFYGSVRLHAIKPFDELSERSALKLGDGASRVGVRGEWKFARRWRLFGRAETGFDILDTFTSKGTSEDSSKGLEKRLLYGGFEHSNLLAVWGKNWSAYYQIAGMADRFAIFGGQAAGIYNAGTDGGATGTGRADDVLQARIYTSSLKALRIKPFNLNLQYQEGQPIPQVEGRNYGKAYGISAWLETETDYGVGLAWQRSYIDNPDDPILSLAGISGHATAFALATRTYGKRWYAALVLSRLENVATNDLFEYIDAKGAELYAQWEFRENWWLVGGGNWLDPDDDDPEAGEYKVAYGVFGLRYTLDSFNRMVYAEYRLDHGRLVDGTRRDNELTIGFRVDFGY